jgi:BirA family biotin operon repressor/biotin-[acetyl-CoA-carboxylase] ligase
VDTKEQILGLLERSRGKYLSGEELARSLGLTRAAVWKAVQALQREGHIINAVPRRGYCLAPGSDVLSVQAITPFLTHAEYAQNIHIFEVLESTNKTAKEMALDGYGHGTVVIADSQTGGRGRRGRTFHSPPGSGLYISFLLSPEKLCMESVTWVTALAGVSVCDAAREMTGREPMIKWVNDVFLDGKKICGILTEALTDVESGAIEWLVLGIGVNVTTSFPEELRGVARALFEDASEIGPGRAPPRARLAAMLINSILAPENRIDARTLAQRYKKLQLVLGRDVSVHTSQGTYSARAVDLDSSGRLIVQTPDGRVETLYGGEVSVKM